MSDLSQDLLVNEDGFELYYARFENNLKSMGDIINFFKKLSKCEQGYAKDLSSITKVDDPKLWRKTEHEIGTFLDCWSTLHTELQKLAQKHEELGQSINNQVTAMEKFYKEKQNTKKQLQKEGNKLTKEMHDSIANLKRAKETYYKDHKTADTTEALYNQRKTEGTKKQKDLDKLHKNSAEAKEKATSADQNYQKTLETANAIQSKFYSSEMPELLREFQKNEEERTNFFKHSMKGFMDSMSQFPPLLSSVTDNLNKAVDKIDTKADVSVFIQEHKGSAVAVPGQIEYEPFGGGDSGSLKLGGSLAGGATIRKTPQSTTPNQPVATVTSTAANANRTFTGVKPSGPLPSFGLTAADEALSVEEKKKKLEGQLTQVKDIIKTEVKSKKGLDKLAVFYQGDPTAQEKAQKEADEQQSRVDKLKAEKKKILGQLSDLDSGGSGHSSAQNKTVSLVGHASGGNSKSDTGDDDENGSVDEGEEYADISAKALFDYEAANDTELAFKAGDILTITEQDTSGWWYAELNGKHGFIPNNYIEVLK